MSAPEPRGNDRGPSDALGLAPTDTQLAAADAAAAARGAGELDQLDRIVRRLRRECPWDREQNERTIAPHTLEEAYELADAIDQGDDAKLLDELGDVLFQVNMLALMLEERGAGDLAAVAANASAKLVRRHPHVFGEVQARTSGEVLRNWDAIKQTETGREPGVFGEVPANLPALSHARKLQRRAASSGFDIGGADDALANVGTTLEALSGEGGTVGGGTGDEASPTFAALGDLLFAAVNAARKLKIDPELALRASSNRFRSRVEAAIALCEADGRQWRETTVDHQLAYYVRAIASESDQESTGRK